MEHNLCQLDELKLSCFGCCGNKYTGKNEVMNNIRHNTEELKSYGSIKEFSNRFIYLRESGICRTAVLKNGRIVCAGHPLQNKGKDFRDKTCATEHECKTLFKFNSWNEKKQKKFIEFLKVKKLDNYDYSMGMDSGKLLEEFEKIK